MTVREFIIKLLDCPMDAHMVIQKELDYNIWINSDIIISNIDNETVTLSFDFHTAKFDEIKRKRSQQIII